MRSWNASETAVETYGCTLSTQGGTGKKLFVMQLGVRVLLVQESFWTSLIRAPTTRSAAQYIWLGWIAVLMYLDGDLVRGTDICPTGRRYLLFDHSRQRTDTMTCASCEDSPQATFSLQMGRSKKSARIRALSPFCISYCGASPETCGHRQARIYYAACLQRVGHGNFQHADAECLGYHGLRYHLYLVPHDVSLQGAIFNGSFLSISIGGREGGRDEEKAPTRASNAYFNENLSIFIDQVSLWFCNSCRIIIQNSLY